MATILYIESYLPRAQLVQDLLSDKGYDILLVEDAAMGYEMALTNDYDLVLLHYHMKGGHEAFMRFAQTPSLHEKIPIVVLYNGPIDGPNEWGLSIMTLPINTRELPRLIEKMLEEAAQSAS